MSNRPIQNSGLERTERLLDLVPFLATHQGISIEDLATEFSISTAQLTEDLTTLWMCGLPGYTALELMDISFDTGYVSISNAETLARPRVLNRDEVLALILGLESILEDADATQVALINTIRLLVAKLIAFLDTHVEQKVQVGTSALSFERGIIEQAIASRGAVEISYHSVSRDEISTRVIMPLEFTSSNEYEYVLAFCQLTRGYRTFRLDRIVSALSVKDASSFPSDSLFASQGEKFPITVMIGSRLRDAAERFNLDFATLAFNSENLVQVESFTADWAIREIMSFGGDIRLYSPADLRKSLRQRSLQALNAYEPQVEH